MISSSNFMRSSRVRTYISNINQGVSRFIENLPWGVKKNGYERVCIEPGVW